MILQYLHRLNNTNKYRSYPVYSSNNILFDIGVFVSNNLTKRIASVARIINKTRTVDIESISVTRLPATTFCASERNAIVDSTFTIDR